MNRIFISYRASDGKKDADRLCADLSRLYGEDQVFFDKQDLRGGTSWRSAIMAALGNKPVVLLLFTPDLLGMQHPEGGRRIDHEDDPIRGEILTAHQHGAIVIPLFTEGMTVPSNAELPEPLRFLKEAHALKLRTEDWATDLARIVADLRSHGIAPKRDAADEQDKPKRTMGQRMQRSLMWVGAFFVGLFVLGLLVSAFEGEDEPVASGGPDPIVALGQQALQAIVPPAANVAGIWWAIDESNRRLRVQLTVVGNLVELQTDPFPVGWYPEWQTYANGMRGQGLVVNEVRYHGRGVLGNVMGVPRIEMPYQALTGDGRGPLDTGSVVLNASADGRELTGTFWSNGQQAESPLRLVRQP
ncbi:toll/interleukin-1 receptor domain-containing protein [Hydrogenophaga sp. BPS33]|uniref:toll/interleukin-1 receptor domain-containing protein n=1 Tax=Hydrogenophaga sp. BPS33 TaxID=2651974 RepID=UPI00131FD38A|nr:toll/interleukin-1 receptor domain-containing protein [Hydrogenophaga sp. BPS33]QHE86693.1 toll/interleukin-1 receptor domain-containing protein [Hydrogenophaga sp. BPS33]